MNLHSNTPEYFSSFSFVFKDTKKPDSERPDHMHDFYEIVYVYKGIGTFFIDNTFYDMKKGDIFLIPSNTIHRALPDENSPVTSTIIYIGHPIVSATTIERNFSYSNLFSLLKRTNNYKINLTIEQQMIIENQLLNIQQEVTSSETGSQDASVLIILQMLINLSRYKEKEKMEKVKKHLHGPNWIFEILEYIDLHIHEPLSLTKLANEALVSSAHFSRIFKQSTGMRLTVYINSKRVIKAKELLSDTSNMISTISDICGFNSVTHFHRIFKEYTNQTPASYRKMHVEEKS